MTWIIIILLSYAPLWHVQLQKDFYLAANTMVISLKVSFPPPLWKTAPSWPGPPHYRGFTITLRHTTRGRSPLDEWSARRRDLYRTAHNTHRRQISMPPAGFELTIQASERRKTHCLDRATTGIGMFKVYKVKFSTYNLREFKNFLYLGTSQAVIS
jgi:hypothetical protein